MKIICPRLSPSGMYFEKPVLSLQFIWKQIPFRVVIPKQSIPIKAPLNRLMTIIEDLGDFPLKVDRGQQKGSDFSQLFRLHFIDILRIFFPSSLQKRYDSSLYKFSQDIQR